MRVFKKKVLSRNHQPWKKKKRRRREERSRDDDKPQPNHIPIDLTVEILSRLPAKSIMRYQCVSKLWSSITRLPSFINSFTSRASPRLLLTFKYHKKKLVFSFPQNQNTDGSYSPVYSYHMENTNYDRYLQWESVQGLILLYGLKIWNPSLRRVLTLPRPKGHIPTSLYTRKSYLGYDPLEGKHKVLSLYYYGSNNFVKPMILTLGAQESWRRVTKDGDGHKWTRQCLPGVRFSREWSNNHMHFKGITDAGELVFAPGSFVDSFRILYFDPRRNTTREALFKGFMDDEFRRSDDGVPNYEKCINVFPNHMESLVSL
ncbi:unnamed protein product [Eruca vesicaria subsp. sativa]|uniref:F-box domain-containing protein n=1 Tax=Eruca vesicaria subsp. sativa TaxID=29727 RepID=A0ABC8KID8_ERUVS|nr:unnamed protein product [Eruca vesicaria subsp. sativa]